jgi:metal-responsive CopG/Arc/MetJ family transcriptional regulator
MKSSLVGVRLPESLKEKLDKIAASNYDSTASQIARNAITEWVEGQWMRNPDMMTIPKESFMDLLLLLDPSKLSQFEDKIVSKIMQYFEFITIEKRNALKNPKEFTNEMLKFIGPTGMHWFEQIEYESDFKQKPMFFKGMHKMGLLWSQVFIDIYQKILDKHPVQFRIESNTIILADNLVYFEMQMKE